MANFYADSIWVYEGCWVSIPLLSDFCIGKVENNLGLKAIRLNDFMWRVEGIVLVPVSDNPYYITAKRCPNEANGQDVNIKVYVKPWEGIQYDEVIKIVTSGG